uniref:Uncharacterized protein n=1 Tax=Arundo donax TaxID=35708 RepID=A0A0A9DVB2_ARUDO
MDLQDTEISAYFHLVTTDVKDIYNLSESDFSTEEQKRVPLL